MSRKDFRIGFRPAVDALQRLDGLAGQGALLAEDFYGIDGQRVGFSRVSFEWVNGADGSIVFAPSSELKSLIQRAEDRL